jgi:hypothetical protein
MSRAGSKPGANAGTEEASKQRTLVYNIGTESEDRRHVVEFFKLLIKIERKRNLVQETARPASA